MDMSLVAVMDIRAVQATDGHGQRKAAEVEDGEEQVAHGEVEESHVEGIVGVLLANSSIC